MNPNLPLSLINVTFKNKSSHKFRIIRNNFLNNYHIGFKYNSFIFFIYLFIYLFILPAISSPSAIKGHGIFVHPFGVNWPIAGESSFYTSFNDWNVCPVFILATINLDILALVNLYIYIYIILITNNYKLLFL